MTAPAVDEVLARLRGLGDPARIAGMARYGIGGGAAWGVTVAELRGSALAASLSVLIRHLAVGAAVSIVDARPPRRRPRLA